VIFNSNLCIFIIGVDMTCSGYENNPSRSGSSECTRRRGWTMQTFIQTMSIRHHVRIVVVCIPFRYWRELQ